MDPQFPQSQRPVFGATPPPAAPAQPAAGQAAHSHAPALTDDNFQQVIDGVPASVPVLIECWAEWCATCKLLLPTIQTMALELRGKAIIATLNVDQNPVTTTRLGLRSMPTILIYRGGQLVSQLFGMQTKGKLLAALGM